jgi:valyl-tRNA synthetase
VKYILQADKKEKKRLAKAKAAGGVVDVSSSSSLLSPADQALQVLYEVVDVSLRVLHPFVPFVTEELWQHIPRREGDPESICIVTFPRCSDYAFFKSKIPVSPSPLGNIIFNPLLFQSCSSFTFTAINVIRNLRTTFRVKPSYHARVYIGCSDTAVASTESSLSTIKTDSESSSSSDSSSSSSSSQVQSTIAGPLLIKENTALLHHFLSRFLPSLGLI